MTYKSLIVFINKFYLRYGSYAVFIQVASVIGKYLHKKNKLFAFLLGKQVFFKSLI